MSVLHYASGASDMGEMACKIGQFFAEKLKDVHVHRREVLENLDLPATEIACNYETMPSYILTFCSPIYHPGSLSVDVK